MKRKVAISLKKITKTYTLDRGKFSLVGNGFNRNVFKALDNVSLDVYQGEKIGIVGPNGAGKTTLLKIIAGITIPDSGSLTVNGKVVSLINLSAGFHHDLTGRENINLNGLLVGMRRKEIKRRFDEIVKFAGIGSFINEAFYTYSSGMKFRLAFAVAVFSKCDILLIDEIFLSADCEFQKRIFEKIREMQDFCPDMVTIVSSHSPTFLWSFSDRFLEITEGKIVKRSKSKIISDIKKYDLEVRDLFSLGSVL
ncbi:ABC transporter ATP-binding protein [Patescibacteria group bacterium]|nr:ABC transporter ATP-binding protein [Patescibacteria group bacterium]